MKPPSTPTGTTPTSAPNDPYRDAELLDRALATEGGSGGAITLSGLEVRPRPHQERILDALDAERTVHDRHRNLVVVAHRKEILDQALRTYREVLMEITSARRQISAEPDCYQPYAISATPRWSR